MLGLTRDIERGEDVLKIIQLLLRCAVGGREGGGERWREDSGGKEGEERMREGGGRMEERDGNE